MNKVKESESSNDEELYIDYFANPQRRKQFDNLKLYQQQKEIVKMSGISKQIDINVPQKLIEEGNQKNYATVSLCCLTVTNPFREKIIRIVLNPWFDRFILIVILANCVFLAIDDPNQPPFEYQIISDYIFLILFTLEMIFKVIAMGFVWLPYSYLRDSWNILDFIVVVMGWISKVVDTSNVSAIRVIRILRPLRTINSIPSMRKLVQSLLNSLPTMLDVFILFMFFLVMFGTVATQLFGGLLQFRCVDSSGEVVIDQFDSEVFCNEMISCGDDQTCINKGNPDFGVSSFDNILTSILNIFIIITLEGWTTLMYYIRRVTGTVAYDIFFILIVIFGSFFIINLMVAVQFSYLNQSFQEMNNQKQKKQQTQDLSPKSQSSVIDRNTASQVQQIQTFEDAVNQQDKQSLSNQNDENQELGQLPNSEGKGIGKKERCPKFKRVQSKIYWLAEHKWFNIFIMALILVNTLFLAMEHYEMPDTMSYGLNLGNSILTCLFAAEMVLKIVGLGVKQYVCDGFNDFDAIVVIVGLLEFANVGSKAITVLRAFRLLRIFKIVRSWGSLRKLLQTVLASIASLANLALLMCLLIFIYALIGMQFFSGDIPENEDLSFRYNFNNFGYSIITIFVLLTAENWNSILYQFIEKDGWGATMYFVSMIIFGNIMLLNLFLAILLNFISESLDQDEIKNEDEESNGEFVEEELDFITEKLKLKSSQKKANQNADSVKIEVEQDTQQNILSKGANNEIIEGSLDLHIPLGSKEMGPGGGGIRVDDISVNMQNEKKITEKSNEDGTISELDKNKKELSHNTQNAQNLQLQLPPEFNEKAKSSSSENNEIIAGIRQSKTFKMKNRTQKNYAIGGKSLFLFKSDSKFRVNLKNFMEHPYFESFIFHLIGLNSLLLAIDQPVITDPYQNATSELFGSIISGMFIIEAVLKIIVLGFVLGKGTYLRDAWNILDFTIVSFSILNWILDNVSNVSVTFLRGFRALRALRPLRMVSKNEGMKIVVNSLLRSIPSLFNVMLISLLFLLVFGILAVQLFQGALGSCNDTSIGWKKDCIGTFIMDGEKIDREWVVPFNNFDNVIFSMITFFEVASLENWPDILFRAIDSQGEDQGPLRDNKPLVAILFAVFIFITTFVVMNLFISVIVDKFNEEIKKKEGSHKFSDEQKEWVKMQRIMLYVNLKIRPTPPKKNKFRKFFYIVVMDPKFEYFIIFVILINTLFLCMEYSGEPIAYENALKVGNIVFVAVFTAECAFKLTAHGIRFYFLDNWNKFDFIIVVLSILAQDDSLFSFKITAMRIIRVARLLRMVKASKGLRHLLKALWLSLANIINVGLILFLIFFTFSVAGMDLFGQLQSGDQINDDANFRTFYNTVITLFRCSTGENWNAIMHNCYAQEGVISIFYWFAFQLLTHYIFLNVFIAVIYENFNDVKASENESEILSLKRQDIKAFVKTWSIFCPNGEHYMKTTSFPAFLQTLPPPLGYGGQNIETPKLNKIIFCLNIKSHTKDRYEEGKVYFPEVMWSIFHPIVGNDDEKVQKCEQVVNIMKQLKRKYKGLGKNVTPDILCGNRYVKNEMTVSKYLGAMAIYRHWKIFQKNKQREIDNEKLRQQIQIILPSQVDELRPSKFTEHEESKFNQVNDPYSSSDNLNMKSINIVSSTPRPRNEDERQMEQMYVNSASQSDKLNNQEAAKAEEIQQQQQQQMQYEDSSVQLQFSDMSESICSSSQRVRNDKLDVDYAKWQLEFTRIKQGLGKVQSVQQDDDISSMHSAEKAKEMEDNEQQEDGEEEKVSDSDNPEGE